MRQTRRHAMGARRPQLPSSLRLAETRTTCPWPPGCSSPHGCSGQSSRRRSRAPGVSPPRGRLLYQGSASRAWRMGVCRGSRTTLACTTLRHLGVLVHGGDLHRRPSTSSTGAPGTRLDCPRSPGSRHGDSIPKPITGPVMIVATCFQSLRHRECPRLLRHFGEPNVEHLLPGSGSRHRPCPLR